MIEFIVQDTGIGVREEDQPKLFRLFSTISPVSKINPNGCGIGLTVSKKYVEKLGGTISLKSKFGEGTTTTFTIPFVRCIRDEDSVESPLLKENPYTYHNHKPKQQITNGVISPILAVEHAPNDSLFKSLSNKTIESATKDLKWV